MKLNLIPIPVSKDVLDYRKHERAIQNFLDAGAENIRVDFLVTAKTWRNKPEFEIEKAGPETRKIFTRSKIYLYVSGGTRVRYAVMTRNFKAKTSPGVIGSGRGRGGVAFISRKHPRPGIQARNFPEAIIKKWEKQWPKLFTRMIQSELGHK